MNSRAVASALWITVAVGVSPLGCQPAPPAVARAAHVLDEQRAIEVIASAVGQYGLTPEGPSDMALGAGRALRLDVTVSGHEFAIAYVTDADAEQLGDAIPPRNHREERLRLVRGGRDGEARVVLLYQANYVYEGLANGAHDETTLIAERQLARDVQDFLAHAKNQGYR
jgi:hypothetical protein